MITAFRVGLALAGEELEAKRNACIWVRDGVVESIESSASCPRSYTGGPSMAAVPQPANAHVHSADYIYPEYGIDLSLEELVAPPHGLKHRLLASSSREMLVDSARKFYRESWKFGVGLVADFRELGGIGCMAAKEALKELDRGLEVLILGRPGPGWPHGCDGLGISSPLDYEESELASLVEYKPAMAHVAETRASRISGDLELALHYGFNGVVHGVYLDRGDLEYMRHHGVGLVLCVRSNMWHGIGIPPLVDIMESRVTVGIGTDNASWIPPDVWEEARTLLFLMRLRGIKRSARWILESLLVGGYRIVGSTPRLIVEGSKAKFLLFHLDHPSPGDSGDPYYWLLKRIGAGTLYARIDEGSISLLGLAKASIY